MTWPAWERAVPLLQSALKAGGSSYGINDVAQMVADGRAQLWLGENAAGVSEVVAYPQVRALNLWLAAGAAEEIHAWEPAVTAFARGRGCTRLDVVGRPGWERVLQPRGFRKVAIVLHKDIEQ